MEMDRELRLSPVTAGSVCCEPGCGGQAAVLMVSIIDGEVGWFGDAFCLVHMTVEQRAGYAQNMVTSSGTPTGADVDVIEEDEG